MPIYNTGNYGDFPGYGNLTPQQQNMVDRMLSNQYDYTYGPGSPDPTREDLNTIYGNNQNRLRTGNYAVPQSVYDSFTPEQRAALGIGDIAPEWHGNQLEKFFGAGGRALRNVFQSGRNIGGRIGDVFRGRVSGGPFGGWTEKAMNEWHNAPGYQPIDNYTGTDPGNTISGPTQDPTDWVSTPWGNTPRAIPVDQGGTSIYGDTLNPSLSDTQASLNPLDYFHRSQGFTGPGSGVPTQRVVGAAVGGITNVFVPGLGFVTGPLARMFVRAMQNRGATPNQNFGAPPSNYGTPGAGGYKYGIGRNPRQMSAYDPNFNYGGGPAPVEKRGFGDYSPFGGLPEGFTESNRFGGGAPTFTGPGDFGPNFTGDSIFNANNLGTAPNAVEPSQGPYHSAGGVPAPGSIGGVFGQGSAGNLGTYWDRMVMRQWNAGRDPGMGFGPSSAIRSYADFLGHGRGAGSPVGRGPGDVPSSMGGYYNPAFQMSHPLSYGGNKFGVAYTQFGPNHRQMSSA